MFQLKLQLRLECIFKQLASRFHFQICGHAMQNDERRRDGADPDATIDLASLAPLCEQMLNLIRQLSSAEKITDSMRKMMSDVLKTHQDLGTERCRPAAVTGQNCQFGPGSNNYRKIPKAY